MSLYLQRQIPLQVIGNAKVTEDLLCGRNKETVPAYEMKITWPISSREERGADLHNPDETNSY